MLNDNLHKNMDSIDLHTAASLGDLERVEEILKSSNKDINNKNYESWTALMYACCNRHTSIVNILVHAGASTKSINDKGQTVMMFAAATGNLNILMLVFEKTLLEQHDIYGRTALFYAVDFGQVDTARYLLSQEANVNAIEQQGLTPLMSTAINGNGAMTDLLLEYGANKHLVSSYGSTARDYALQYGHSNIAQVLEIVKVITDLKSFLKNLGLEKYWPIFQSHNVDLEQFLTFTEEDLKNLGIVLFGPRRKMAMVITHFKGTH